MFHCEIGNMVTEKIVVMLWMVLPGDSVVRSLPASSEDVNCVGKMPWRRKRQPTPVFLVGKIPGTEEPGGLQPTGLQRV